MRHQRAIPVLIKIELNFLFNFFRDACNVASHTRDGGGAARVRTEAGARGGGCERTAAAARGSPAQGPASSIAQARRCPAVRLPKVPGRCPAFRRSRSDPFPGRALSLSGSLTSAEVCDVEAGTCNQDTLSYAVNGACQLL